MRGESEACLAESGSAAQLLEVGPPRPPAPAWPRRASVALALVLAAALLLLGPAALLTARRLAPAREAASAAPAAPLLQLAAAGKPSPSQAACAPPAPSDAKAKCKGRRLDDEDDKTKDGTVVEFEVPCSTVPDCVKQDAAGRWPGTAFAITKCTFVCATQAYNVYDKSPECLALAASAATYTNSPYFHDSNVALLDFMNAAGWTLVQNIDVSYLVPHIIFSPTFGVDPTYPLEPNHDSAQWYKKGDVCMLAFMGADTNYEIVQEANETIIPSSVYPYSQYARDTVVKALFSIFNPPAPPANGFPQPQSVTDYTPPTAFFAKLQKQCGRLYVTGHSQGGGVAHLLAFLLNSRAFPGVTLKADRLYTFGGVPALQVSYNGEKGKCFDGGNYATARKRACVDDAVTMDALLNLLASATGGQPTSINCADAQAQYTQFQALLPTVPPNVKWYLQQVILIYRRFCPQTLGLCQGNQNQTQVDVITNPLAGASYAGLAAGEYTVLFGPGPGRDEQDFSCGQSLPAEWSFVDDVLGNVLHFPVTYSAYLGCGLPF